MSADDKRQSKPTIKLLVESEATGNASESDVTGAVVERDTAAAPQQERKEKKVAVIDRLVAANMLVAGSQLGPQFQDQYRRIKRPLLSNAFGKTALLVESGNLILVTSSIPGEGKTYTAINLALSIAHEKDKTVLLVDCDVARQGASRMLGVSELDGLVDVLEGNRKTIGDAILQTDIPNLRILTAGRQDEYVTELLASQRMTDLVNELASRYDDRVIIIDGPPLLSTPQTQILAELAGQIVFVIEAGKTSQALVDEALDIIPEEKATGVVMNKAQGSSIGGGYYYGYYDSERLKNGRSK